MPMTFKSSIVHRPNTNTSDTAPWWRRRRIQIALGIATALIVAIVLIFIALNNTTASHFNTITPTIGASDFSDENHIIFSDTSPIPDINNNRTLNPVQPWFIGYYSKDSAQPVFKSGLTESDLNANISITPSVRGAWKMRGQNAIEFTPNTHWPTGTKFTIHIAKKLFTPDIKLPDRRPTFTTPAISNQVIHFTTYPAPDAPQSVVAAAVITFSAPINTAHFNDKVSLKLDNKKLPFTTKFDKFHRTILITSTPIPITDAPQVVRLKINRVSASDKNSSTPKITANTTIAPNITE